MKDICTFYEETGSQLCHDRPGSDFSACNNGSSKFKNGSCPELPVYAGTPVLNRCMPKAVAEVGEMMISNLYGLINSWDVIEQVLGDLYKTWREILALSFLAFGKNSAHCYIVMGIQKYLSNTNPNSFFAVLSLFMIAIFHLLATIVTWIVIILVSIACTGKL